MEGFQLCIGEYIAAIETLFEKGTDTPPSPTDGAVIHSSGSVFTDVLEPIVFKEKLHLKSI